MGKIAWVGALFVGCAAASFTLLLPRQASSAVRNIAGAGCTKVPDGSYSDYYCPLVTDDTYNDGNMTGAWFDFVCPASGYRSEYHINKYSFTGTWYTDWDSVLCTGTNSQDKFVSAVNVKTNATTDDYLWATVFQVFETYGIETTY